MLVARQLKLDKVSAISHRPALDPSVIQNLNRAFSGNADAIPIIDQQIINKITIFTSGGGRIHLIGVLNPRGDVIVGRLVNQTGTMGFLARGDLGVQVHAPGNGELHVLGQSFNDMVK